MCCAVRFEYDITEPKCNKVQNTKVTKHKFFKRIMDSKVYLAHYVTKSMLTDNEETREMMAIWPDIVRDIMDSKILEILRETSKWMEKVLQYNVPGGKKNRGLTLVYTYKLMAPSDQFTEDNIRLARILAWCVEIMHAHFIVLDDIQDQSLLRRNQPSWYCYNDKRLTTITDSLLLKGAMYVLIQKYFKGKECYVDILETFQNVSEKEKNVFTNNKIKDPKMLKEMETILLEIGNFFQVEDDYLGCYEKSEVFGKDNTDIQEGKCTWLIVNALKRAILEQPKILEECYGVSDPEKVECVKQLYNELGLPNTYSIYEEETYNLLKTYIQQISHSLPHDLFLKLLNKIYHRKS
ncbi:farnesyl pyrophosphate synthase-like [Anoplolepis gracilipes]|uniref:farnesyl pyrophosphate synthase-like n=1 Tax=Anoplolepis gracilipes TaxID=354296 RepID=UPI003BA29D45